MACNCKNARDYSDITDKLVESTREGKKIPFILKADIAVKFVRFYYYFVISSLINLMFHDRLEPKIPKFVLEGLNR